MATLLGRDIFPKTLSWSGLAPFVYSAHFSLKRIMPGVDNFRYDVQLSPVFKESVSRIIFHLILKTSKAEEDLDVPFQWTKEREDFLSLCQEIMLVAVKRAKMGDGEVQIDYLAQMAVSKFLIQEINNQFDGLLARLNNQVWEYESTEEDDLLMPTLSLKERITEIRHNRNMIVGKVNREIFQYLLEAQKSLKERREANYGTHSLLNDDIFSNPLLHIDNQADDAFMLENYVLMGHRMEDPDKYETLLELISGLLGELHFIRYSWDDAEIYDRILDSDVSEAEKKAELKSRRIQSWLREVENVNVLLDYQLPRTSIDEKANKPDQNKKELHELGIIEAEQKKIFNAFYDKFKQKKIVPGIIASFEMKSIYLEYCPPLVPQQCASHQRASEIVGSCRLPLWLHAAQPRLAARPRDPLRRVDV